MTIFLTSHRVIIQSVEIFFPFFSMLGTAAAGSFHEKYFNIINTEEKKTREEKKKHKTVH